METLRGDGNIPETKQETRWDYLFLREYLLTLARGGRRFLVPLNQYPSRIELSNDWHSVLNQMRRESEDRIERLTFIKEDKRDVYLSPIIQGQSGRITGKEIVPALQQIVNSNEDILGDIHSHSPRGESKNFWGLVTARTFGAIFSPTDLHSMLAFSIFLPVKAVVGEDGNMFAFKTKEGKRIPKNSRLIDQKTFEQLWFERCGFRYLGEGVMERITDDADPWAMNIGIARMYNLVLYKGDPDQDLIRVFPEQL